MKNILIGEVWLASGQSNMEMPLKGFAGCCIMNGADDIIVSAENKGVRMFTVPKHQTYELQTDCKGSWNISSIETAPDFSATAYYFATSLSRALRIPVGIICSAYGGSTVEGWISRELLETIQTYLSTRFHRTPASHAPPHADVQCHAEAASELYHQRVHLVSGRVERRSP